jgi:hypothetical protein
MFVVEYSLGRDEEFARRINPLSDFHILFLGMDFGG